MCQATRDTRNKTSYSDSVTYGCTGNECDNVITHVFTDPSMPYERISNINLTILYKFAATNITIGEGYVYLLNDSDSDVYAWQNYSLTNYEGESTVIYYPSSDFVSNARKLKLHVYVDGTQSESGNVTVTQINYTWSHGKLFEETNDLFVKVKVYRYTPLLENGTVTPTTGGWGENFTFSVKVRDRFGRNVTVYAWHRKVGETWQLIDSYTCVNCLSWTQMNFTYDYICSDIGTWEFKFNATNTDGNNELYSTDNTYVVEKDDINVDSIMPAWNATVNRSQPYNFTLRIWDRDNQTYAFGLTFGQDFIQISKYGSNETYQTFYPSPAIDEQGYAKVEMKNDTLHWCQDFFSLGQNYWKGGVSGATCYKDNITEPSPYYAIPFMLYGDLSNRIIKPNGTVNYTRTQYIELEGDVYDDCGKHITDATVIFKLKHGAYEILSLIHI